jgi:hypothetical protein
LPYSKLTVQFVPLALTTPFSVAEILILAPPSGVSVELTFDALRVKTVGVWAKTGTVKSRHKQSHRLLVIGAGLVKIGFIVFGYSIFCKDDKIRNKFIEFIRI